MASYHCGSNRSHGGADDQKIKTILTWIKSRLPSKSLRFNVVKTFKAPTQERAHAKADAWLKSQSGFKNVARQAYIFRAAFPLEASPDEGLWTVVVRYEQNF